MKVWVWILLIVAVFIGYIVYTMEQNNTSGSTAASATGGVENAILNAISSFENVASSHNNPTGICGSYDANGNCLGPKTFDSIEAGIQAGLANIGNFLDNNPGMTVVQFVKKWSGATGTTLDNYVQHVADALGLGANDPITNAAGAAEVADNTEPTGDSSLSDPDFAQAVSA